MKTTYVTHCEKCKRQVEISKRDQAKCPPEKNYELKDVRGTKMNVCDRPYSRKFDGRHFYPNVGKHFDSHKEYERYLKDTGRDIVTDGSSGWDRSDEAYMGHELSPNEKRRKKTIYLT